MESSSCWPFTTSDPSPPFRPKVMKLPRVTTPRRIDPKHPRMIGPGLREQPVPSSPWPPRTTSLPSSASTESDPALPQMTSSRVVPASVSSAAVPVIVHSVRAPATLPVMPFANAGATIRAAVAMVMNRERGFTIGLLSVDRRTLRQTGRDSAERRPRTRRALRRVAGRRRLTEFLQALIQRCLVQRIERVARDIGELVRVGAKVVELLLSGLVLDVDLVGVPDRAVGRDLDDPRIHVLDEEIASPR